MSFDVAPIVLAVGGAVVAGASGLGGIIKFGAWWQDRKLLVRAHFARLTGIDVPDGHASLLALHERLGGSDSSLRQISQAISRLDLHPSCASPRAMVGSDWRAVIGKALSFLTFLCLALLLIAALAIAVDRVNWNQSLPISKLMAFCVGGLYAGGSALLSWVCFKEVNAYIAAYYLRQAMSERGTIEVGPN